MAASVVERYSRHPKIRRFDHGSKRNSQRAGILLDFGPTGLRRMAKGSRLRTSVLAEGTSFTWKTAGSTSYDLVSCPRNNIATLRAAAGRLFFRVARSLRIDQDMLVARALKNSQLTSGESHVISRTGH
jgi:hypothetical protein